MGNLTSFTFFDTHSCHSLTAKADCTQKSHFSQSTRCGQDKTKLPYPATVSLLFLHPSSQKQETPLPLAVKIPASRSCFTLASRVLPQKNSQIPHPAKSIVGPHTWTLNYTYLPFTDSFTLRIWSDYLMFAESVNAQYKKEPKVQLLCVWVARLDLIVRLIIHCYKIRTPD